MREIKFRAWNKIDRFMLKINDSTTQKSWYIPNVTDRYEIMQFTGLKDRNEQDIYEGDIVRITNEDGFEVLSVVKFQEGCFDVVFREPLRAVSHIGETYYYVKYDHLKLFTRDAEVIGNIWENPELMEDAS